MKSKTTEEINTQGNQRHRTQRLPWHRKANITWRLPAKRSKLARTRERSTNEILLHALRPMQSARPRNHVPNQGWPMQPSTRVTRSVKCCRSSTLSQNHYARSQGQWPRRSQFHFQEPTWTSILNQTKSANRVGIAMETEFAPDGTTKIQVKGQHDRFIAFNNKARSLYEKHGRRFIVPYNPTQTQSKVWDQRLQWPIQTQT